MVKDENTQNKSKVERPANNQTEGGSDGKGGKKIVEKNQTNAETVRN